MSGQTTQSRAFQMHEDMYLPEKAFQPIEVQVKTSETVINHPLAAQGEAYPPPIQTQPNSVFSQNDTTLHGVDGVVSDWIPLIEPLPSYPQGFEYLAGLTNIFTYEEQNDVVTSFIDAPKKFSIVDNFGRKIYDVIEEGHFCQRNSWNTCGVCARFELRVTDRFGKDVLKLLRSSLCCSDICCAFICERLEVTAADGEVIGYIKESGGCCSKDQFVIQNENNEVVLKLRNSNNICLCKCSCKDPIFSILQSNDVKIGEIRNKGSGGFLEAFPHAGVGIKFPSYLDVSSKALLLGAAFYIDCYMYYNLRSYGPSPTQTTTFQRR